MSYSHGFTPENLQAILWKQSLSSFLSFDNYHAAYGGKSPLEEIHLKFIHFEDPISPAVKQLEAKAIEETLEECYTDKWMKTDYANIPAVQKCSELVRHRVMGEYLAEAQNTQMKLAHDTKICVESHPGDISESIQCLEDLKSNIDKASKSMVSFMKQQYSGYMSQ